MQFQVFIPSPDPDGFDVTLLVEARNWMEALRLGLRRTYSEDAPIRNVLCDIKAENLVHVIDQSTRRMFKIRQLDEPDRVLYESRAESEPSAADFPTEPDMVAVPSGSFRHARELPAAPTPTRTTAPGLQRVGVRPVAETSPEGDEPGDGVEAAPISTIPTMRTGEPLGIRSQSGAFRVISTREIRAQSFGDREEARLLQESVIPTSERLRALSFDDEPYEEPSLTGSAIEDVFLEIPELFEGDKSLEDAVAFSIDLAMQHVRAESGSVLFLNETGDHLNFAAARGPKADDLLERDFTVPIGKGIAGFCAREGVSLVVSDVAQDPRFYREISQALGYPSESIICAPIQSEGRSYGAIELVNHRDSGLFNSSDLNILTYIAAQTGRFIQNRLM